MGKKLYVLSKSATSAKSTSAVVNSLPSVHFLTAPPSGSDWVEVGSQPEGVDPTLAQPAPGEKPLVGQQAIADFMYWSLDMVKRRSKELQRKGVFFRIKRGRPPNRRVWVMAFPSTLKAYIEKQSKQKK